MADFMHRFLPESRIWIPKPTWANHHKCALLVLQRRPAQDVAIHNAEAGGSHVRLAHSGPNLKGIQGDVLFSNLLMHNTLTKHCWLQHLEGCPGAAGAVQVLQG